MNHSKQSSSEMQFQVGACFLWTAGFYILKTSSYVWRSLWRHESSLTFPCRVSNRVNGLWHHWRTAVHHNACDVTVPLMSQCQWCHNACFVTIRLMSQCFWCHKQELIVEGVNIWSMQFQNSRLMTYFSISLSVSNMSHNILSSLKDLNCVCYILETIMARIPFPEWNLYIRCSSTQEGWGTPCMRILSSVRCSIHCIVCSVLL